MFQFILAMDKILYQIYMLTNDNNEPGKSKITLETSGEDAKITLEMSGKDVKIHSKRVEKIRVVMAKFFNLDSKQDRNLRDLQVQDIETLITVKGIVIRFYIFPTRFVCSFTSSPLGSSVVSHLLYSFRLQLHIFSTRFECSF